MPYNPKIHSNQVIDKPYKQMLREITQHKGQTLKRGLEFLIQEAHKNIGKDSK